eukprot:2707988-Rhodomonas_salina.1
MRAGSGALRCSSEQVALQTRREQAPPAPSLACRNQIRRPPSSRCDMIPSDVGVWLRAGRGGGQRHARLRTGHRTI